METWRLIETESLAGFVNMAIDEALLDCHISDETPPTLRFYKWEKPTVSIGRNQSLEEINIEECKNLDIDITRRPTGGKAVLHENEFTYSFISGKKYGMPERIFDSYIEISKALIDGFKNLKGNFYFGVGEEPTTKYIKNSFCFASSTVSDLNYNGRKFVGSAQLRKSDSLLQHGSILINLDFKKLAKIFNNYDNNPEFINLSEIIGFTPDYKNIKNCVLAGFKSYFNIQFKSDILSDKEKNLAKNYYDRYKIL
jgi:lipoate-protein ligase A